MQPELEAVLISTLKNNFEMKKATNPWWQRRGTLGRSILTVFKNLSRNYNHCLFHQLHKQEELIPYNLQGRKQKELVLHRKLATPR